MFPYSVPFPKETPEPKNYVELPKDSTTAQPSSTKSGEFVVFTEGLTRQQAEIAQNKENLISLFDKYDDGDGVISHDEFKRFYSEKVETGRNGKTTVGGKYTVQQGDTLDKIAREFRTTAYELYKLNRNVIGNDINKIQIGMELVIFDTVQTEETIEKCDHTHEEGHVHEEDHDHGEKTKCSNDSVCDASKLYAEKVLSNHQSRVNFYNIFRTLKPECKDMSAMEVMEEFYKLDNKQKQEFLDKTLMQMGIDVHKADLSIVDGCVEEFLAQSPEGFTINGKTIKTIEDYNNLDFIDQADVRHKALEARLKKDLADGNPNNRVSKEYEAIKDKTLEAIMAEECEAITNDNRLTAEQKENKIATVKKIFDKINSDNTKNDEQKKFELARVRVIEAYRASDVLDIAVAIQKGNDDNAMLKAQAYLDASYGDKNTKTFLSNLTKMSARIRKKALERLVAGKIGAQFGVAAAETCAKIQELQAQIGAMSDKQAQIVDAKELVDTFGKEYTDDTIKLIAEDATNQEALKTLVDNNKEYASTINEIYTEVASTTTDTSRKEMLNTVIEYTNTVIANTSGGNSSSESNSTASSGGAVSSGASIPVSNQAPVSNPILPQFEYVNQLKQASQAFVENASRQEENSNSVIPEQFRNDFKSVSEYLEFKPTGMSVPKYRSVKHMLQQNFTMAVENLIKHHSVVPDKFKAKIHSLFGSLDNKTRCELFIEGNAETRQFMKKYQYMNGDKLLSYAETHQDEVKGASKEVRLLIEELKKEEEKSHA